MGWWPILFLGMGLENPWKFNFFWHFPLVYTNIDSTITGPWVYFLVGCPIVQQGGRHYKNIGWALCSDNDVTKTMTSLLPILPAKILGGGRAPPAPPSGHPPAAGCRVSGQTCSNWDFRLLGPRQSDICETNRCKNCRCHWGGQIH